MSVKGVQGPVLIRVFNHFFHRRTLLQVFLDLCLIVLAFLVTQAAVTGWDMATADQLAKGLGRASLMAVGFLAINATLGFYDKSELRLTLFAMLAFSVALAILFIRMAARRKRQRDAQKAVAHQAAVQAAASVAGLAAGMGTVAATYGYLGQQTDISRWNAHLHIDSPIELLKFLQSA